MENQTAWHWPDAPAPRNRADLVLNGPPMCRLLGLNLHYVVPGVAYIMRQHEICDARRDFGAEARPIEYAVMADAGLQPMCLETVGKVLEQMEGCFGLADA